MLQTAQDPEPGKLNTREDRARRANSALGRILRYVGLVVGIVIGWNLGVALRPDDSGADWYGYPLLLSASIGALLFLLTPYMTIGFLAWLRQELRRIEASDLAAVGVGLLVGGLVSTLLALPISMLPDPFGQYLPFVVAFAVCTVAVVSAVTKKRELMAFFRLGRDTATETEPLDASLHPSHPELLIDTSAIIDGRIAPLAECGFLPFTLIVPQFVLHELQLVADSEDPNKRTRGVRGLGVLEQLRTTNGVPLEIRQIAADGNDVDAQLVSAAKLMGVAILSGDTNLERVATLQDVSVLNLHHLAQIMRPIVSTGESMQLKIVQPGREYQQGVGFLDDGTMIVVEDGEQYIGQDVNITITRTIQTSGGRMMFARLYQESDVT